MSKEFSNFSSAILSISIFFIVINNEVQAESWTLESSAQRVLQEAPAKQVSEAEIEIREGNVAQASLWPNPTIELGASNAMGKDDGNGGTDFNLLSISQPLPLSGRLGLQKQQQTARLMQAKADSKQQGLLLEYEAARVYHALQFSYAQLQLAEQRLESANEFQHIGRRREQAGDLSRLERLRLDLVRESAKQDIASAKGVLSETISEFQTVLNIDEKNPRLERIKRFPDNVSLLDFTKQQDIHPALVAAREGVSAAHFKMTVARANRFVDPEIWLAGERDYLGGSRQNTVALGVSVTLPLWDRSKGDIAAARANKKKKQREVDVLQRELGRRLQLNYLHLQHLIEQGREYRTNVLEPAEEIFQLTRKGFASGQVEILNLVDAVDTYFNARIHHLKLIHTAWLKIAALRRVAGLSLLGKEGSVQ